MDLQEWKSKRKDQTEFESFHEFANGMDQVFLSSLIIVALVIAYSLFLFIL